MILKAASSNQRRGSVPRLAVGSYAQGQASSMAEECSVHELEGFKHQLENLLSSYSGDDLRRDSKTFCVDFCKLVEGYTCRWQVPLPQLRVLQIALCYFVQASSFFTTACDHVHHTLSSVALSVFELLLFFDQKDFLRDPLKLFSDTFQECHLALARHQNVHMYQITHAVQGGGPWANSILQAILTDSQLPQNEVDRYLGSELPVFFELRVQYLLACKRVSEAMALAKCCARHPSTGQHLFFLQVYLTWLCKTSQSQHLHKEVSEVSGKDAVRIICNLEHEEKNEMLLALSKAFLSQQLQRGDMYYLWDLVFIWSKLLWRVNPSKQVLLEESHQLLQSSTNVKSIFPFIRVILAELGEDGLQFCVELCANALQSCLPCDASTKSLIYKTIASLLPNDLEVCRACALLVFFVERTVDAYKMVFLLHTHPDQEYQSEATPVGNHVRFEILQILKKGLYFDPEFWNLVALRTNCLKLMSEKVVSAVLEDIMEEQWVPNYCTKEPALRLNTHPSSCRQGTEMALQAGAKKRQQKDDRNHIIAKKVKIHPHKTQPNIDHTGKRRQKQGSQAVKDTSSESLRRSFWQPEKLQENLGQQIDHGEHRRITRLSEKKPPKRKIRKPRWLLEDSGTLEISPKVKKHSMKRQHQKQGRPAMMKRSGPGVVKNNAKHSTSENSPLMARENETECQRGDQVEGPRPPVQTEEVLEFSQPDNELEGDFTEDCSNKLKGHNQILLCRPTVNLSDDPQTMKVAHRNEVVLRARDASSFAQQLHCYVRRPRGKGVVSNMQVSVSTITRSSVQSSPPKVSSELLCEKPVVEMKVTFASQTPAKVTKTPIEAMVSQTQTTAKVSAATESDDVSEASPADAISPNIIGAKISQMSSSAIDIALISAADSVPLGSFEENGSNVTHRVHTTSESQDLIVKTAPEVESIFDGDMQQKCESLSTTSEDEKSPLNTSKDEKSPINTSEDEKSPINTSEDEKSPINTSDDEESPINTRTHHAAEVCVMTSSSENTDRAQDPTDFDTPDFEKELEDTKIRTVLDPSFNEMPDKNVEHMACKDEVEGGTSATGAETYFQIDIISGETSDLQDRSAHMEANCVPPLVHSGVKEACLPAIEATPEAAVPNVEDLIEPVTEDGMSKDVTPVLESFDTVPYDIMPSHSIPSTEQDFSNVTEFQGEEEMLPQGGAKDVSVKTSEDTDPMGTPQESEESRLEYCCTICNKVFKGKRVVAHAMFHYRTDQCMFCGTLFKDDLLAMMHLSEHIEKIKKCKESAGPRLKSQESQVPENQEICVNQSSAETVTMTSPSVKRRGRPRKSAVRAEPVIPPESSPHDIRKLRSKGKPPLDRPLHKDRQNLLKYTSGEISVHKANGHIGKKRVKVSKATEDTLNVEQKQTAGPAEEVLHPEKARDGAEEISLAETGEPQAVSAVTSVQGVEESHPSAMDKTGMTVSPALKVVKKQEEEASVQNTVDTKEQVSCPVDGCVWQADLSRNRVALLYHALEDHDGDAKPLELAFRVGNSKCSICMRVLWSFQHYQDHVIRHRDTPRHPCLHQGCSARFKTGIEMRRHTRRHSPLQAVCCLPGCSKLFICLWALNLHEREHYASAAARIAQTSEEKQQSCELKDSSVTVNKTHSSKAVRKLKWSRELASLSTGKDFTTTSLATTRKRLMKMRVKGRNKLPDSLAKKCLPVLSEKGTSTPSTTSIDRFRKKLGRKPRNEKCPPLNKVSTASLAISKRRKRLKNIQVKMQVTSHKNRATKLKKQVSDVKMVTDQKTDQLNKPVILKEETDHSGNQGTVAPSPLPLRLLEKQTSQVCKELIRTENSPQVQEKDTDYSNTAELINFQEPIKEQGLNDEKNALDIQCSPPVKSPDRLTEMSALPTPSAEKMQPLAEEVKIKKLQSAYLKLKEIVSKKHVPKHSKLTPTDPSNSTKLKKKRLSPDTTQDTNKACPSRDLLRNQKPVKSESPAIVQPDLQSPVDLKGKEKPRDETLNSTLERPGPSNLGKVKKKPKLQNATENKKAVKKVSPSKAPGVVKPTKKHRKSETPAKSKLENSELGQAKSTADTLDSTLGSPVTTDSSKVKKKPKATSTPGNKKVKKACLSKNLGLLEPPGKAPPETPKSESPAKDEVESRVAGESHVSDAKGVNPRETAQVSTGDGPGYSVIVNGHVLSGSNPQKDKVVVTSLEVENPNAIHGYGKRPFIRLPPTAYLDERYTTMPKRRKEILAFHHSSAQNVQGSAAQDVAAPPKRQRCANCFLSFSSADELQTHLSLKKCSTLFGFDSDDEGNV